MLFSVSDILLPTQWVFSSGMLQFTLLGGLRSESPDRLRVTLKIECLKNGSRVSPVLTEGMQGLALRQNLDLYNDAQFEKLVRKTAERFTVGISQVGQALSDLTSELEVIRFKEMELRQKEQKEETGMPEAEKREALEFLCRPDLLALTNAYIGRSGVIGEEQNRLLMFLVFTSRKTASPLHIISFGSSGSGKTHLQEKVAELIPPEDKIEMTALSGNAFYYFDREALGHKLLLIEDLDGAMDALYPMRELQSKQKLSKTVSLKDRQGNLRTVHLEVSGPVCVAGCTTKDRIYEDNANRSFLLYLDESEAQDQRIMEYQRKKSAGRIDTLGEARLKKLLQNAQRLLRPVEVRNPYAEHLLLPKEVFKPRRTNAHYMAFIEAVTFYRQYQRVPKEDPERRIQYIETTPEDIEEANLLMKELLLRKSDELSGRCRQFLEKIKKYLHENGTLCFSNTEIRQALRENASNQKRYMLELQEYGYVKKREGNRKQGFVYELTRPEDYGNLEKSVQHVLDETLLKVKSIARNLSTATP